MLIEMEIKIRLICLQGRKLRQRQIQRFNLYRDQDLELTRGKDIEMGRDNIDNRYRYVDQDKDRDGDVDLHVCVKSNTGVNEESSKQKYR